MSDICFSPAYARVFEETDGPSETFEFKNGFGEIRHTFLLREIPMRIDGRTLYDISTPYGYGGPIILNSTDKDKLMQSFAAAFKDYCRQRGIVSEFVRFHLTDNTDVRARYYGTTRFVKDNIIVPTDRPYDTLWTEYEHKVRKNVKKAHEYGLDIVIEQNMDHVEDFMRIYYDTMNRNEAREYYYFPQSFFEKIAAYIPYNYLFFHVLKDGVIISTELVLISEQYVYSFLGGTDASFYHMRPNDYLKDEVIKLCVDSGKRGFVLGGGYHDNDGIYRYKRSFTKADPVPFYVGTMIFDQDAYVKLAEERIKELGGMPDDPNFFPLYRA